MGTYIPSTAAQRAAMLQTLGKTSADALFADIPPSIRLQALNLPNGMSELALMRTMQGYAQQNRLYAACFRGAGAYDHYIPSIVKRVTAKEEFVTAYTPYQAEISQGILQSIFEYQTMICELTGMQVSNASVYDGATAAAEAMGVCREAKRTRTLLSCGAHPDVITTMQTYAAGADAQTALVPLKDGKTDLQALAAMLTDTDAAFYFAQPNYFGLIEDAEAIADIVHKAGAKLIMGVNPIAAALLKSAGECGADVAVGEGQPLGMPLSFGGPYLGFMAVTQALTRKLPGRRRLGRLAARAHRGRKRGRKRRALLCANAASARAAYQARESLVQYLLQSSALRHDGQRLSCRNGPKRPLRCGAAMLR